MEAAQPLKLSDLSENNLQVNMKPATKQTSDARSGSLERSVSLLAELQSREATLRIARMATHAEVGREMREARQTSGLSLRETARRLKCSAPFLSDMEMGRRGASIEWVQKLATVTKQANTVLCRTQAKTSDANEVDAEA